MNCEMEKMILSMEDIKKLCTESSFERGIEYFQMGNVTNLEQFGNRITATVKGTSDYKVTIHIDNEGIKASCTCPYDWGGYCKHIVATLIALSENYPKIERDKDKKEERIKTILDNLSLDELKDFLRTEFEENPSLRDHFTIHFLGKDSKGRSLYDYKKEIELSYRELSDHHGFIKYGMEVNFSYIRDLADRYIKVKNFYEAATIYQALSEVIAENMGEVDDSDGYYADEFVLTIEDFVNCINRSELDHKGKKGYIGYFFSKYIENDPDYFREYYGYALREICHSRDDLEYWKKLLKPHLPNNLPDISQWCEYYQMKEILKMQLYILDLLNNEKEFYDLIKKHYRQDQEFCLFYIKRLIKDGKNQEAVKVAEEGLTLFPDHLTSEIRRFLNKFYKKHSPEKYKQNLINLFLQDRDWNDYEKLKEICPKKDWKEILSKIINNLSEDNFNINTIIELYLKESMFEKALKQVLAKRSLSTLNMYHKDLSEKFSKKYFNAYKELLIPFADSKTGRPHYRNIVKYLIQMKRTKGFEEEFTKLVKLLKTKYAKRPAFLDEMEAI